MDGSGEIKLTIGGQERKIVFGLGSTRAVCNEYNINLADLDTKFGLDDLFIEEIFGGLVFALQLEDKTPDFNRAQVYQWIDKLEQSELQKVFDVWLTTTQHGQTRYEKFLKLINQGKKEGEKKNAKLG